MSFSWKLHWNQVLISLLIGVALGIGFGKWQDQNQCGIPWKKGKNMQQFMVEKLSRELQLNPEQKTQVAAIFAANKPKMKELHQEMRPKFEAIRNSVREQISVLLTPEQQVKFVALQEKMEKRRAERRESRHKMFEA